MWLSTRIIRDINDPEWSAYCHFIGLHHLKEVRSIDSWCNPYVSDGSLELSSITQLAEALETMPYPLSEKQYYQLVVNAQTEIIPQNHPHLTFLGYDLSDWTWTSSLLNCGRWQGELAPIACRVNQYGLLDWEDAILAQKLLPDAWHNDHHAFVQIWALFSVC